MTLFRYTGSTGFSIIIDLLIGCTFLITIIQSSLYDNIQWKRIINPISLGTLIWLIYTFLEVLNPTSKFEAWVSTRQLIYGSFAIVIITSIIFTKKEHVFILINILSVFTLIATIKAILQKYVGFDPYETRWLYEEGGAKTHIIYTGTRYFSIFTDASNFGSNMGFATFVYGILPFYTKKIGYKIYYILIAALAGYCMFISGTRGAIVVPLAGLAYFCILSKSFKGLFFSFILLVTLFFFFAFTTLGESNNYIRRMRTAFNPTEDASFNVRIDNQKLIAEYMANKPFGEGLGLGGTEAQRFGHTYINTIPVDSWYIKLWVETGIIGLMLYIIVILTSLIWGSYILMFKIQDPFLRGTLATLGSGCFGLMVSAYGNSFFGQYPTHYMVFIILAIIGISHYLDKQSELTTK